MGVASIIDRYRRPEYTGENRCLPCTAVNGAVAAILGTATFLGLVELGTGPWVALGAEIVVFAVCGVQIWLRGYLVPGTPTLTRRYLPGQVLRWFGKDPDPTGETMPTGESQLDVEGTLLEVNALRPVDGGENLELAEAFAEKWRLEMDALDGADLSGVIAEVFDVEGEPIVRETARAVGIYRADRLVGQWESRPALVADLAACRVLGDRDGWTTLPSADRIQVVSGLRLYIERCPACAGRTSFDTGTAASCCREYEVVTVSCEECGARLFELPVDAVPDGDVAV